MSTINPTFSGEFQLAGWSESHNGGCKVTFWLSDSGDLEAFRAMTVRKGNQSGQRLAAVLVEIGDDELPVRQPEPEQEGYGKHYAVLYKAGWFHNPKVIGALGIPAVFAPADRIEAIKQILYEAFNVESLTEIPPVDFAEYWRDLGVTLPAAFGGAA